MNDNRKPKKYIIAPKIRSLISKIVAIEQIKAMIGNIVQITSIDIPLLTVGLILFITVCVVFRIRIIMSTGSIETPILSLITENKPVMTPSVNIIPSMEILLGLCGGNE